MKPRIAATLAALLITATAHFSVRGKATVPTVTVASKTFPESYILAEIIAETIEGTGEATVNRRFGLGATGILAEGLRTGAIDIYPEYSGTIAQVILKDPKLTTLEEIRARLLSQRLVMSDSLGFNNTYVLGVRDPAWKPNLKSISDLGDFPGLRFGFTYEFMNRPDGYPALVRAYDLHPQHVQPMEHSLAYEAIARGHIDVMDAYSTDAKIDRLGLHLLKDDRHFFPKYDAVLLANRDFARRFPKSWLALRNKLENAFPEKTMRHLNAEADLEKKSFRSIAVGFLNGTSHAPSRFSIDVPDLWLRTRQHLVLVVVSVLAAVLTRVPLGILANHRRSLGQAILALSGVFQTIPSLALLCFLIPLFGVGNPPALVALFLYALLPIVANTYLSLSTLDPSLLDSEKALGLSPLQRLRKIELPLASPGILSGIRTSTVTCIGTATLAALIGAGGYGVSIITGLALNDIPTILTGALPAALLALIAYLFFAVLFQVIIPRGLR
jgi:osmoprotectant transport system permease protein